jgi:hypothetical protein
MMILITKQVYMAVPDEDQTKEALQRIEKEDREPGHGEVIWHELDLKDPRTAKASAERFMEKEERLDILGLFAYQYSLSTAPNHHSAVNNAAQSVLMPICLCNQSDQHRITDLGNPKLNRDGVQYNMAIK